MLSFCYLSFFFYMNLRIYTIHFKTNLGHTCFYIYIIMYVYIYIYIYIYTSLHTHTSICIGHVDTQSHAICYTFLKPEVDV